MTGYYIMVNKILRVQNKLGVMVVILNYMGVLQFSYPYFMSMLSMFTQMITQMSYHLNT